MKPTNHRIVFVIVSVLVVSALAGAATLQDAGPVACSSFGRTLRPMVGEDSRRLPGIRLIRTLPAPNEHYALLNMVSGTSNLTWSPDGERLAAYVRNGAAIMVWSPDGKIRQEIPRYNQAALTSADVLGFVSGHSQLLTGPAASDPADPHAVDDVAFSILDADTGKVVHNVIGLNPGKSFRENIVRQVAISPDQRLVAVIYNVVFDPSTDRRIGIYATDNWRRIAAVALGEDGEVLKASAMTFSHDGKMFAAGCKDSYGRNTRVDIFDVNSWTRVRSIKTFPDPPRGGLIPEALRFSDDGSMSAIILGGGGLTNRYPNGERVPQGRLIPSDIPEPFAVFRISDGARFASAGGFIGGLEAHKLDWPSTTNFIVFLDVYEGLYFWNPQSADGPRKVCDFVRTTTAMLWSTDGKLLSEGFADGVHLYENAD